MKMPGSNRVPVPEGSQPMSATMIQIEDFATEVTAVPMDDLEEFLRDPLGYGTYNWADPITLDEFAVTHHAHEMYMSVLT